MLCYKFKKKLFSHYLQNNPLFQALLIPIFFTQKNMTQQLQLCQSI